MGGLKGYSVGKESLIKNFPFCLLEGRVRTVPWYQGDLFSEAGTMPQQNREEDVFLMHIPGTVTPQALPCRPSIRTDLTHRPVPP